MSTRSFATAVDRTTDDFSQYRALSKAAVFSVTLAILSLLALIVPGLLIVPLFGIACGVVGVRNVRRDPQTLTGSRAAWVGLTASAVIFVAGSILHTVIYMTEVPEGYERISFYQLQPDEKQPDLPVSPKSLDLNGKRVFVKGYVHKNSEGMGPLKSFVLVPDMGTCCFGGQPKLTDMIEVTVKDDQSVRYSRRQRKLAGVLKVDKSLKPVSGLNGTYYQLEAEVVQ